MPKGINTHQPCPSQIDGARTILWCWSGEQPFGYIPYNDNTPPEEIFGLAICTFDEINFYRFACDREWEVQNDSVHDSIEDAINRLPNQFKLQEQIWMKIDGTQFLPG